MNPPPQEEALLPEDDHSWTVSIGTPYCTDKWQVADSKEQNGVHKNETKAEKQMVIQKKGQLGLPMRVEKHDIVGIVHRAWMKSFANVATNKKAIAERGWNPLTRVLLDHPELKNTKRNGAAIEAYSQCLLHGVLPMEQENLNFEDGPSKTFLDKIVDYEVRKRARQTALIERKEQLRLQAVDNFNKATKITAGVVFKGHGCLLDRDVTRRVKEVHQLKLQREEERVVKKRKREEDEKKNVEKVRSKGGPDRWSTSDYKVMVSWFKRPGDSKLPTTKNKLMERYALTCNRREDDRSRLKEGEEPVVDASDTEEPALEDADLEEERAAAAVAAAANATVV